MVKRFPLPKMLWWFYLVAVLLLPGLTACGVTPTPTQPVSLTVAGSTSMVPLIEKLAAAYTARQPQVAFDIQGGGSRLGQQLVEGNQVDIGLVSWPPPHLGDDIELVPVAGDAIALVLHPDNHQTGLSLVELQEIFSGRLLDWRSVDGPALPIQVVSREDGSGTRAAFEALVMEDQPVTPAAIVLPNDQAVVDFVADNPEAIGYVSFRFVTDELYAVPVEGITPTQETLTAEQYPVRRALALLLPQEAGPAAKSFVAFVVSPAGQAIVGEAWGRIN
jgi:phosphate transport system substrate-binding protein